MPVKFGRGQSVPRVEDAALLQGRGRYTDDLEFEGELHGVVVRSPFAHARIREIDTAAAEATVGVQLVWTHAEIADQCGPVPCIADLPRRDGSPSDSPPRFVLARDVVRYVGDPVAFIVAESLEAAESAAELLEVDWEPLDASATLGEAAAPSAPLVWTDAVDNISLDWAIGDEDATASAFAEAAHITTIRLVNQRVVPNSIEPRTAIARYSDDAGFWLHTPSQGVWTVRSGMAATLKGVEKDHIRVVTEEVGGGFGMKGFPYPEHALVLLAARALKRAVRWASGRGEAFQSDTHGRDVESIVELAFDADARILGYRVRSRANLGAYHSYFAPYIPTLAAVPIITGAYRIPNLFVSVDCILTHTPPVDAYRGAGRPEAAYMLERAMSEAAAELGLSQDEIRRRNMIRTEELPYTTATDATYDSGDFRGNLEQALSLADHAGFEDRRRESLDKGSARGFGLAYYVECAVAQGAEEVDIHPKSDGGIEVYLGIQPNGQGHATTFRQIIATELGLDPDKVEFVIGDSARKRWGGGTSGSKSLALGGNALVAACRNLAARAAAVLAENEGIDPAVVELRDGFFRVPDTNIALPIGEAIAELAGKDDRMQVSGQYEGSVPTFPNGCHIVEAEIDLSTGALRLDRYLVVDDFGTLINPLVVEGQVQGGVAQGIGQAIIEECRFEAGSGQLLTGSFLDYGLPRADDIPSIGFRWNEIPCRTNPLGVKGCGEAGTIGALPAVMNAVADALRSVGAEPVDMPATPEKLWRAVSEGAGGAPETV